MSGLRPEPGDHLTPPTGEAAICVLASGSAGNCSLLMSPRPDGSHAAVLIDLGLSPRRTRALLAERGLTLEQLDAVVLTHLDGDHCHQGWCEGAAGELATSVQLLVYKSHLGRALRMGLNRGRVLPFREEAFPIGQASGRAASEAFWLVPRLNIHDALGSVAFRIETASGMLGYATDVGRVTGELIDHLKGVDTLAIESNYCPVLQESSNRPVQLKKRITGGRGHLSNHQCVEAVRAIAPASHVILLHLSRQCNRPEIAAPLHEGSDYTLILSSQEAPTPWVPIRRGVRTRARAARQMSLFG